ncbi:DDE transposase [Embleya hyalina]|uniref:DDE transposase n=1 Tax=Embleya hyalina TaxID=516124 RepID=A0A401Z709_9ACTN|nr:DDE transposase [Embleya hyalina]
MGGTRARSNRRAATRNRARACLDPLSGKTSGNVPAAGQGIDAGKKIVGRKRHVGVDTVGLLLAVWVTAASVSDNTGGIHLPSTIAAAHPTITKARIDSGYRTRAIEHGAALGIDVKVVQRDPAVKGFRILPRRWTSNTPWDGSCTTAASPATTKPTHTAPKQ